MNNLAALCAVLLFLSSGTPASGVETTATVKQFHKPSMLAGCENVTLDVIFADPLRFNGHTVCTSGYLAADERLVAFYPHPVSNVESMLDIALVPDGESYQVWRRLINSQEGRKFGLIGKLFVWEDCFARPKVTTCTPVRRPIFISALRAVPVE